jgi:transcriptional regulator with XRE-family HTH domain
VNEKPNEKSVDMKPERATGLGQLLKAKREERALSTHRLAAAAGMDQATIVRLEAGSIAAPRPDKLSRIALVLGISGADVFALAGYTVPTDLPSLRPYMQAKYDGLLDEDLDRIETYVARIAKKRGASFKDEPASRSARVTNA